jgi:hypothetical protein
MDLITHLPPTQHGHDAVVVFVDRLTKMVHFAPTKTIVSDEGLARLFVHHVWSLHGLPKEIVSDRDPRLTGNSIRSVCNILGTRQSMSTAYHPESDGQTERVNRVLEDMLRHYVSPTQVDWDDHLDAAEFAVNNSWHRGSQDTPFRLNYGCDPMTPLKLMIGNEVPKAEKLVQRIQEAITRAKRCLTAAQEQQQKYADQHRKEVLFQVGQKVMLHTVHIKSEGCRKLLPRWLGPFVVTEVVAHGRACRLQLPPRWR